MITTLKKKVITVTATLPWALLIRKTHAEHREPPTGSQKVQIQHRMWRRGAATQKV